MNEPVTVEAAISHLPAKAAKMAAIEILLADPDSLHDDVLEACLYVLRERLRGSSMNEPASAHATRRGL